MDTYPRLRKSLVVGIILLFVGMSIIPSTAQDRGKPLLPTSTGWTRTFGGEYNDYGYTVQQTSDGGYIIVGETYSFGVGNADIWVIKTDGDWNKVWDKTFGGVNKDYNPNIKQTNDNGFIITAKTYSFGAGENDIWVIKLDENGTEQWNTTYGGKYNDAGHSIDLTSDGGYIITGIKGSYVKDNPTCGIWLIKTDSQGNSK